MPLQILAGAGVQNISNQTFTNKQYFPQKLYYERFQKIAESLTNNYIFKQCYNYFMSPRNFAKQMMGPYFLSDKHYSCSCGKVKKHSHPIRKFIDRLRTPAKMQFEHLPYQATPVVPEAEIDLKAIREQRRVAKESDQ